MTFYILLIWTKALLATNFFFLNKGSTKNLKLSKMRRTQYNAHLEENYMKIRLII